MEDVFLKICKIHRKLPPGGILVFLTGRKEIVYMCSRIKLELNNKNFDEEEEDQEIIG